MKQNIIIYDGWEIDVDDHCVRLKHPTNDKYFWLPFDMLDLCIKIREWHLKEPNVGCAYPQRRKK